VSPDGTFIVTGGDKFQIWEENKADGIWEERHVSMDGTGVSSVVVSPDSSFVVTGNGDDKAQIWFKNNADGIWEERQVLEGHTTPPWATSTHYGGLTVAVSPDSTYVVTGGSDGTARIWATNADKIWEERQVLQHSNGFEP
jgi:WD40 repeat protein